MLAVALIVFREVLEASLIVGIVMAATRGTKGRGLWVAIGVLGGLAGACTLAAFADVVATAASGLGQEILNAGVLFAAVAMLGWHNVWMKRHSRELATRIGGVGRSVVAGARPMYALAIVVGLALLREGSEAVLFLYGIATAGGPGAVEVLAGSLLAIAGGVAVGLALYLGLMRIPMRHIFAVTGWMILLLAAGMAAQGAHLLVQAGLLPPLGAQLWNTSALLPEDGLVGRVLHLLVGYSARPDGIEVLAYILTLALILGLMNWSNRGTQRPAATQVAAIGVLALAAITLYAPTPAQADCKVYSPQVEQGEVEVEARGCLPQGNKADEMRTDKYEVGYGVTDWWSTTVFLEYQAGQGEGYHPSARAWENIFALTEPGRYWLDLGLYLEYEWAAQPAEADEVEVKALLEKTMGHWTHTANLIFNRTLGGESENAVSYAWQTAYRWRPEIEPAVEVFGGLGDPSHPGLNNQAESLGPAVLGRFRLGPGVALTYEVGYLFGLTDTAPDGAVKWALELSVRI